MCPLTEADLADGVGPAPALAAAGSPLALGSDGHSVIDLVDEARWLELSQRLVTRQRGHFTPADLAAAATAAGHACLGWPDAGEIVPGAYADLVTLSARLAPAGRRRGRRPAGRAVRGRDRRPTSGTWWRLASTWSATGVTCWWTTCRARSPPRSARCSAEAGSASMTRSLLITQDRRAGDQRAGRGGAATGPEAGPGSP